MAQKFYAVRVGHQPGIYRTAEDWKEQTSGFPGSKSKSFASRADAEAFMEGKEFPSKKAAKAAKAAKPAKPKAASKKPKGDKGDSADVVDERTGRVVVYVDGACKNNQFTFATAGVGVYFGDNHPDNYSKPLEGEVHTNQRSELTAILTAYRIILARQDQRQYEIRSDSAYAINCVTVWCKKWLGNGWLNSKGKPVVNKDLISLILAENGNMPAPDKVTLSKVAGHSGDKGNDAADKLARAGVPTCRPVRCNCALLLVHSH